MNKSACLDRSWLWHVEAMWVFTVVRGNAGDPVCAGSLVIVSCFFGADLKVPCLEGLVPSLLLRQLHCKDTATRGRQHASRSLLWACQICASEEVAPGHGWVPRARLGPQGTAG